jgi:hypothetical protein
MSIEQENFDENRSWRKKRQKRVLGIGFSVFLGGEFNAFCIPNTQNQTPKTPFGFCGKSHKNSS